MNEIERIKAQYRFHNHDRLIGYVEYLLAHVEKLETEREEFKTALDKTLQRKQDAIIQYNKLREALEGIKHRARFSTENDLASGILSMAEEALKEAPSD